MTPDPYPGQDKFLRSCLLNGKNALQKQAARKQPEADSERHHNWEHALAPNGHADGWGLGVYTAGNTEPRIIKNATLAAEDRAFKKNVKKLGAKKPSKTARWLKDRLTNLFTLESERTELADAAAAPEAGNKTPVSTLLAHVRLGPSRVMENAHPFQYGNWSFIHNGFVPEPVIRRLEDDIEQKYRPLLNAAPQGTTDTERVFYYLLGRIQEEHGTLSADDVDARQLAATFGRVVREIIDESKALPADRQGTLPMERLTYADKAGGNPFTTGSRIQTSPACNFVLTNGNILLASAYRHKLFLGIHQTPGGKREVMLASEKIQPKGRQGIDWWEVPWEHMVMLERKNGDIQVTLQPF